MIIKEATDGILIGFSIVLLMTGFGSVAAGGAMTAWLMGTRKAGNSERRRDVLPPALFILKRAFGRR